VSAGTLTLACCKPALRRHAAVGDRVFSFAGKTNRFGAEPGTLVAAFQVDEAFSFDAYSRQEDLGARPDNIYRRDGPGPYRQVAHALRHTSASDRRRDLSADRVLLSKQYRYFWRHDGPAAPQGLLGRLFGQQPRGHRRLDAESLADFWSEALRLRPGDPPAARIDVEFRGWQAAGERSPRKRPSSSL
jgi:hypothetical protein